MIGKNRRERRLLAVSHGHQQVERSDLVARRATVERDTARVDPEGVRVRPLGGVLKYLPLLLD